MKAAVVDIGSNTIKLIIGHKTEDRIEVTFEKLVAAKLSQHIDEKGNIEEKAINHLKEILESYITIIQNEGVSKIQCIATEAIRKANNADEILRVIQSIFPDVKLLSGEEEAKSIAEVHIKKGVENGLIIDIGGGSVEFIVISDKNIKAIKSTPLGTLALKNNFKIGEKITPFQIDQIQKNVNTALSDFGDLKNPNLYGTEGSFTNLYRAIYKENIKPFQTSKIQNKKAINQLKHWSKSTKKERLQDPFIDDQRKHVGHIASALLLCILKEISPNKIVASSMGLKESILHELLL